MEPNENIHVRGRHFHCSLCDIKITSEKAVQDHLGGKKHQRILDLKNFRQKQVEKSIFVGGLNKLMSELVLTDHFMKFGDVSKIVIDKDKGQFAIVEFSEKEAVLKATEEEKHTLQGSKITVRPREYKPFAVHRHEPTGEHGRAGSSPQANRYGTIPAELQKAILLRLSPAENVSDQMNQLVSLLELPTSAIKLRYLICSLLEEVFKEFFPMCQVFPFGSSVNGFGIQGSDLDLHLELDAAGFEYKFAKPLIASATEKEESSMESQSDVIDKLDDQEGMEIDVKTASPEDIMDLVCKVLRQCVPSCKAIKPILHARRPVVKFQHKESKLCCDISMSNRLALRNTELLCYYANLDDRVRPLIYAIRHWGKVRQLAGNPRAGPRLTNYALSLMVVYYLQTREPSVLPTVDQLRGDKANADVIEGWDCSFCEKEKNTTNTESSVDLLREFFHFYSTFDFTTNVISLKTGTALPISTFAPPESPVFEGQSFRLGPLNIQDPFELSHNVAFNVNEKIMQSFCKQLKKTYTLCLCLKFKKKPASSSVDVMSVWGLPVLFDAESYADQGPRRGRSGSTSTEGSVPEETSTTHSIVVPMKASQLSEAFVKAHSTPESMRTAWCDATVVLIERILSDVLKIHCEEMASDEDQATTNESLPSAQPCTATGDENTSLMEEGGADNDKEESSLMQTDLNADDEKATTSESSTTTLPCTSKLEEITILPDGSGDRAGKSEQLDSNKRISDAEQVSPGRSVESKDNGDQSEALDAQATRKHQLDNVDDDDDEKSAPRKKVKLMDDKTDAGVDLEAAMSEKTEVMSVDEKSRNGESCPDGQKSKFNQTEEGCDGESQKLADEQAEARQFHMKCSINHQVWLGRRKVRRQLNQSSDQTQQTAPSDDKAALSFEDRLNIETLVTDHIITQDSVSSTQPLTTFKVGLEKHYESGQCSIDVGFQPIDGPVHFKMLFHFLQTFLVKLMDQHQV
ncbi:speckle targeted PIP5K1A-regulated poly(A) polymerase-like [Amphiura filiformis]|uniref:speckle targeted PIP5K1A-regulated poly(A) polymerase-like n=1 Tax=Amphiura filiformis TaxID=82378 RepID=UPI003B21E0DD